MKVSELGEFGLIDLVARLVEESRNPEAPSWKRLLIGIGDDAAVWRAGSPIQLTKVDSLVEGVHFIFGIAGWADLGWKSLAISLSDIAAMGGLPLYELISLALPPDTEVDDVSAFCLGNIELANQFGVAIVGGNISRAPLVAINTFVTGEAADEQALLTRSAARPGDKIAVTGYVGSAAAGLRMLLEKRPIEMEAARFLKVAFLHPQPRIKEGQLLVKHGVKTAIDISDGLVSDLGHICQASGVGAKVWVDRVPVAPAVKNNFQQNYLELALSGGEDYELLFTATPEIISKVSREIACPVTVIGEITEKAGEISLTDSEGKPYNLASTGWDHFKNA